MRDYIGLVLGAIFVLVGSLFFMGCVDGQTCDVGFDVGLVNGSTLICPNGVNGTDVCATVELVADGTCCPTLWEALTNVETANVTLGNAAFYSGTAWIPQDNIVPSVAEVVYGLGNTLDGGDMTFGRANSDTASGFGPNLLVGDTNTLTNCSTSVVVGFGGTFGPDVEESVGIGSTVTIGPSASFSTVIGPTSIVTAPRATAIGPAAAVTAPDATALGSLATTRVAIAVNIGGAIIGRRSTGELPVMDIDRILLYSAAVVTFSSEEIDLTLNTTVLFPTPTNSTFYPNAINVIQTITGTGATPVSITFDTSTPIPAPYGGIAYPATQITHERVRLFPLATSVGTKLGVVTIVGKPLAGSARIVIEGLFVEDE